MMSITNRDLIVRGYDAFDRGDVGTVLEILDPNIHWHVPGRSPLSGDYKGHDEVVGFFTTTQELLRERSRSRSTTCSQVSSWWWCCAPSRRSATASTGHLPKSTSGAW